MTPRLAIPFPVLFAEGQLEEGEWAGASPGSSTLASGWNSSLAVWFWWGENRGMTGQVLGDLH